MFTYYENYDVSTVDILLIFHAGECWILCSRPVFCINNIDKTNVRCRLYEHRIASRLATVVLYGCVWCGFLPSNKGVSFRQKIIISSYSFWCVQQKIYCVPLTKPQNERFCFWVVLVMPFSTQNTFRMHISYWEIWCIYLNNMFFSVGRGRGRGRGQEKRLQKKIRLTWEMIIIFALSRFPFFI